MVKKTGPRRKAGQLLEETVNEDSLLSPIHEIIYQMLPYQSWAHSKRQELMKAEIGYVKDHANISNFLDWNGVPCAIYESIDQH